MPLTAKIGRLRFDEAAADLVTDYTINGKRSVGTSKRHVTRLKVYFGGMRMAAITGAEVRQLHRGATESRRRERDDQSRTCVAAAHVHARGRRAGN